MGKCDVAGCEGDDKFSYTCNECGLTLCSKHRLPENHNCTGLRRSSHNTKQVSPAGLNGRSANIQSGSSSSSNRKLLWIAGVAIILLFGGIYFGGFAPVETSSDPASETPSAAENDTVTTSVTTSETLTKNSAETGLNNDEIENLVHKKVNEIRTSEGLNELSYDSGLQEIARYHSEDMAQNDYFAHTSPDGEEMGDRYEMFDYECRADIDGNQYATGGENIFKQSFTGYSFTNEELATESVEGWINSQSHRDNILKEYWTKEGIGVDIKDKGSETIVYVTQNFC